VLQLKFGSVRPAYFTNKYGVNILQRFAPQFASLDAEGDLKEAGEDIVSLTRQGLLRVDALLPRFFLPQHTGIRYT
jgi:oxygen-independent coproporphyrinogen-3 oxidase